MELWGSVVFLTMKLSLFDSMPMTDLQVLGLTILSRLIALGDGIYIVNPSQSHQALTGAQ